MGLKTTSTPYGTFESPFDISSLVMAAGASFVSRWTTYQPRQITATLKKAIQKKGFSFLEVITQCPVQFGKKTGSGSSVQMFREYKEKSISVKEAVKFSEEELRGKIVVGELVNTEKPEMVEEIMKIKEKASGEKR
jgi:2-oxoglutarate ferredoxin oxidoreductase subunit beta